jgi:exoribonuclease R
MNINDNNEDKKYKLIRFRCEDKLYNEWEIYDSSSLSKLDKDLFDIDPIKNKIFNQDTFKYIYNDIPNIEIVYSSVRQMSMIPGVLLLDKQYGIYKNKYLYKFNPDDKRIPYFLVPYKIKHIGFSKNIKNIFVTIKYLNWDFKHPYGQIIQNIGNVDILENFYEYQLYCKSLNASIQSFTKSAIKALQNTSEEQYIQSILKQNPNIENRLHNRIITIDAPESKDLDDAFGIDTIEYNGNTVNKLSIYISNVAIWMEALNLWSSFSKRISTIYLPDRKRPMLPSIMSDILCSLKQNNNRFAFTLDLYILDKNIIHYEFKNTLINVTKNFHYETTDLLNDLTYINSYNCIKNLSKKFKSVYSLNNSHNFISYIMTLMNYMAAKEFQNKQCGIFRSAKLNQDIINEIPIELPKKMKNLLINWNSSGGFYMSINENTPQIYKDNLFNTNHDIMKLDAYVHITSPIRRLVDLLNIIILQNKFNIINMSQQSIDFYNKWTSNESIEYINTTMRAIRKLQGDCQILKLCIDNPELLNKSYNGIVFDRIQRTDGLFQYVVYIPELYMIHRHTTRHFHENYTSNQYKLYIFNNEFNFKKKILLGYTE